MEALFFVLIGAALFSHSWSLLGLYHEGRTMGLYVGGLGLVALIALMLPTMLLVGGPADSNVVVETNVMKVLIILWAGYAIGVGAHGLWEFDDRAIGFYSAFLFAGSLIAVVYYAIELNGVYGDDVWIGLSAAPLVLTVLAAMLFFYLAIPFIALRKVAGWFILVGSIAVAGVGFAILTSVIDVF
jgi:hypothetical protein